MKFLIAFILSTFAMNIYAQTQRACSTEEANILRRTKYRAAVAVDRVARDLDARLARNDMSWSDWRKLHVSKIVLSCARAKLGTLNYVCADNLPDGLAGYTVPIVTNKVYIDSFFFTYDPNTRLREGLLVHEATHHCGTNDGVYLNLGETPRDADYVGWQVIADTYTYWIENRFCLPGEC
ncbi:MAG: hypothetical protein V4598_07710 [Bdellovibrionota bacterium]